VSTFNTVPLEAGLSMFVSSLSFDRLIGTMIDLQKRRSQWKDVVDAECG
jgi:hypothetical protein